MERKLKIAVFGTASLPIPPFEGYGGTQRGIYDFITHMNQKGHKIHLFGPGDSQVSHLENLVLHSFVPKSLWIPENDLPIETKRKLSKEHYKKAIKRLEKIDNSENIDIINVRSDSRVQEISEKFGSERIVYSMHNLKNQSRIDMIKSSGIQCIAHCRNHKEQHENLSNIKVITYGINVATYPFSPHTLTQTNEFPQLEILKKLKENNQDYLITLGAIGIHKGQKTSAELALESKIPLIIAGEPQDRTSNEKGKYFNENIVPLVDNEKIFYFGNANEEQKKELLKYAKGFLFPSGYEDRTWEEPFGRAPVESLSTGTPVIAYKKGSMNEIIFDSFNGYLFDSSEEAIKRIKSLDNIDRIDCRKTVEKKFDSRRVIDEYEELFYDMVKRNNKNNFFFT
ncbi:MAG: glycosyltransferase [Candidatus Pacearchaeota archaeon]